MRNNDWINKTQYEEAITQPLGTVRQQSTARLERVGGYYIEEVRRRLIDLFGETAKDGPHSVYAGGLWFRTPIHPHLQEVNRKELRVGRTHYDRGRGRSGPIKNHKNK